MGETDVSLVTKDSKITRAQTRGREVLKFSPLVTDAYFHYTPSQIMLAALSIADHDLFERMVELIFAKAGGDLTSNQAEAMAQVVKAKTISTVLACKEMLMQEPPERLSDFYGTVSPPSTGVNRRPADNVHPARGY